MLAFVRKLLCKQLLHYGKKLDVVYYKILADGFENIAVVDVLGEAFLPARVAMVLHQGEGEIRFLEVFAGGFWIVARAWSEQADVTLFNFYFVAAYFDERTAAKHYVYFAVCVKMGGVLPCFSRPGFLKIKIYRKQGVTENCIKLCQSTHAPFGLIISNLERKINGFPKNQSFFSKKTKKMLVVICSFFL